MRESAIERKLKAVIESTNGKCLKFVSPGMRGVPDRICLLPGARIIFVETKTPRGKPTALQLKRHEELRALGFDVRIINSEEQIYEICTTQISGICDKQNT